MQFASISLVLAYGITVMASPLVVERDHTSTSEVEGYSEFYREPAVLSDGYIVYYGSNGTKTSSLAPAKLQERSCKTTATPVCSSSHAARNDICTALVTELFNDAGTSVSQSPRQICYEGAGEDSNPYCCVSWHSTVDNLIKGDLAPLANAMLTQCTANGISGKTSGIVVREDCTDVCLSNRGTHC
ncbi:hypothetical protein OIDMADRAFT_60420 [Oidiodendron maius Zn]|uniref:WD-like domain-containing protein n=1 Tax=Oidiodendron maius (strain Zn) TaxID=913774 RepID=A0A0C3C6Y9_OIDMZ|nr:hypothetical protein OIDMADRAFT_60420 [Oidiodendron maius Zn]